MTRVRIIEQGSRYYGNSYERIDRDHPLVQGHPQEEWRACWEVFVKVGETPVGFLEAEVESECSCHPYVVRMGFHHSRCTAVNPNVR